MTRVRPGAGTGGKGLWLLLATLLVVLLYPWAALRLAHLLLGAPEVAADPAAATVGLLAGTTAWPGAATAALAALAAATAAAVLLTARAVAGRPGKRTRVDAAARSLAPARELRGITPRDVAASAARLRGGGAGEGGRDEHGVLLGTTLRGTELRMDWESTAVAIAGPRVGKTTSLVTPAIAHAPLPVVTSSNKADVHDDTRSVREGLGPCWVFDPQAIATDGAATFWVDLLAPVTNVKAADRLAVHFEAAAGASKTNGGESYFVTEAHNYLSALILAAAAGGGDLLHVAEWAYDPNSATPQLLLSEHGYHAKAAQLRGIVTLTDRQRDGVVGTARSWLAVLDDPRYSAWVVPPRRVRFTCADNQVARRPATAKTPATALPLFDPSAFVLPARDGKVGTLYTLSKEGPDAAVALTTALVGAVFDAGERAAGTSPGRRLSSPVLFVLDEAANCVRLKELPDKYSHYGSRGLPVITILQSWSQGEVVWGAEGMNKLWSAANIVWYGGGVKEDVFLQRLANLVGDHDVYRVSTSHARGGGSRSVSSQSERVLSADKLAALPRGRAVILSSGNRAVLARTVPWMEGPKAAEIAASKKQWEPR